MVHPHSFRAPRLAATLLGIALLALSGSPALAQDTSNRLVLRAIDLLSKAPITFVTDSGTVLSQREFLAEAAGILRDVPGTDRPPVILRSALDGVRALESLLTGFVPVELWSDPPGMSVSYRRSVEIDDAATLTATTNDTLSLHPGWYDFWWTQADGSVHRTRVGCVTRCRVAVGGGG